MAIWLVFLSALYWSSQNGVETVAIPKEHLKEAILCLKECIGEDFVPYLFRTDLSYGEYLGDLCKNADANAIQEKIKKYARYGSLKVQECLEKKNLADVYTKFRDFGSERLTQIIVEKLIKLEEELLESDEPQRRPLEPKNVELSLTQFPPWDSVGSASAYKSPKPPAKDSDKTNTDQFSDLGNYTIGLCMKDDTVNFQELEDHQDKENAFDCLKDCETRFMMRIEDILKMTRGISINTLGEVIDILKEYPKEPLNDAESALIQAYEEFMMHFIEKTDIKYSADSVLKSVSYTSKIRKISDDDKPGSSHTISDIDILTLVGKTFMNRYRQVYTIIDKYRCEISKPPNGGIDQELLSQLDAVFGETEDEESPDSELWLSFVYYQFCAKVQCYMKAPESVPLYNFIHEEASKPDTIIQLEVQNPSQKRKFYVALIGRLDDKNGIDDNSSDKKGKAIISS